MLHHIVPVLDFITSKMAGYLPGCCGGVFYHPKESLTHFDAWQEPGAVTIQVGRMEIILDRS